MAKLEAQLKLKRKELEAHAANKPPAMKKPNDLSGEQKAAYDVIAGELDKDRGTLAGLEEKITKHQAKQKTLTDHIALAKKLEGKFDNFQAEHARLKQETEADLQKLSLDFDTLVALTIGFA